MTQGDGRTFREERVIDGLGRVSRGLVASGTREGGVFPEQDHVQPWEGVNFQSSSLGLSLYGDLARVSSVPTRPAARVVLHRALRCPLVLPLPAPNL